MAVGFRTKAEGSFGTRTSISVTKPAGVEPGDLMLVCVAVVGLVTPAMAGWTQATPRVEQTGGTKQTQATFYKFNAGEAGPWEITWGGASLGCTWNVSVYSGVSESGTINANAGAASGSSTVSEIGPTITTTVANCMLVMCGDNEGGETVTTKPAGFTDRVNNGMYISDAEQVAAGASGAKEAKLAAAAWNTGQLIALAPATGGGGGSTNLLGMLV